MQIEINTNAPRHVCAAHRIGPFIFFTCPHCDYVRRLNDTTGEFTTSGGEPGVLHEGMSYPAGIDPNYSMN